MNSFDFSFLSNEPWFNTLLQQHIAERSSLRTFNSRRIPRSSIVNFRRWWLSQGRPNLTQEILLTWMLYRVQRAKVETVASEVHTLNKFLSFVMDKRIIHSNPLIELLQGHRSYHGIVSDLQRTGSVVAVINLADYPFSGPLGTSCLAYLESRSALGKRCTEHRYCLISFERFLRRNDVISWYQVDQVLIEQWLTERNVSVAQRRHLLLVLENLFRFLTNFEIVSSSPVPSPGPYYSRPLPPHIFSRDEIRTILDETVKLPDHRLMPYRGQTYRMLFLTLYTLGLRASEALNLRLGDIDFTQHCLTIGQTKFYKGRVLPFGPRYEMALHIYIDAHPLLRSGDIESFLFPTNYPCKPHLARDSAYKTLVRIIKQLSITTPAETRPPNLHSFRHCFAVHWIEQWLREGIDVQVKLPLLSAFLGHVNVAATQVYLTMTPERLRVIGERFENAIRKEVGQ